MEAPFWIAEPAVTLVEESVSIFTFKLFFDGKIVPEIVLPVKRGMMVTR